MIERYESKQDEACKATYGMEKDFKGENANIEPNRL